MPELMQHQREAVERITKQGSLLLADQQGVGKSASFIMATKDHPIVLILTLAGLKHQMKEEIHKWLPNAEVVVIDGNKKHRQALWQAKAQYYVANYELLLREDLEYMLKI